MLYLFFSPHCHWEWGHCDLRWWHILWECLAPPLWAYRVGGTVNCSLEVSVSFLHRGRSRRPPGDSLHGNAEGENLDAKCGEKKTGKVDREKRFWCLKSFCETECFDGSECWCWSQDDFYYSDVDHTLTLIDWLSVYFRDIIQHNRYLRWVTWSYNLLKRKSQHSNTNNSKYMTYFSIHKYLATQRSIWRNLHSVKVVHSSTWVYWLLHWICEKWSNILTLTKLPLLGDRGVSRFPSKSQMKTLKQNLMSTSHNSVGGRQHLRNGSLIGLSQ